MLQWISENSAVLQLIVSVITAAVWLIYLQLFLSSFLRQRRPEILISRGVGVGVEGRCFIANLGLEPIYVAQILIRLELEDEVVHAAITDRESMAEEEMRDLKQATNQGPLRSGDSFDAGSFGDLVGQALRAKGRDPGTEVRGFALTVVAVHAGSAAFVGARRRFDLIDRGDYREVQPDGITTRQLRNPIDRIRLRAKLRRDLRWYRS